MLQHGVSHMIQGRLEEVDGRPKKRRQRATENMAGCVMYVDVCH